jgi:aminoglycoside phosphotransferase (APT) family kinase protein
MIISSLCGTMEVTSEPIVRDAAAAASLEHGAAIVLDPLREFLDAEALGGGEIEAAELGDGHSNLTFLLRRGEDRFVLKRPPRGKLAASANDVLREARILQALEATPVPAPRVLALCDDPAVIGAPFFVMSHVEGAAINDGLSAALQTVAAPARIATRAVEALATLHAVDLKAGGLDQFGRPSGYLERQLRRFGSLLETNATRPLPELEQVADWLVENMPESRRTTFVHGDFRLGNLLFAETLQVATVLDWEMATVGDPLADLGYLTAMWAAPDDADNPMFSLSRLTRRPDFPRRRYLASAYAEATGEPVADLRWYQVLALWKSAIFLEGSYRRFIEGASGDAYFRSLGEGVPALARTARQWTLSP